MQHRTAVRAAVAAGVGVLAVLAVGAASAEDEAVTFVNQRKDLVSVLVMTGSSGEMGDCAHKDGRKQFDLAPGSREKVAARNQDVCYCWIVEADGPLRPERHCQSWHMAMPGETVTIQ